MTSSPLGTRTMALRRPRVVLILFAAALVLPFAAPAAESGETKTFADKNVKWTLPDEGNWAFQAVTGDEKQNGYVAKAAGRDVGTQINLMVRPTEGLDQNAFLDEVVKFARTTLKDFGGLRKFKGKLSGHEAACAWVHGKGQGDVEAHVSIYVLSRNGNFYLAIVQAFHGAHKKAYKVIDAARRGIRLINGSGPEEKPATGPLPDADSAGGGGDTGDPSMDGDDEIPPEKWPANGPKWEEGAIVCKAHNLRWRIPEGSPFKVTGVAKEEKRYEVPLVILKATKGEGDEASECEVVLITLERKPGFLTSRLVNDMNYQEAVAKSLHERLPGRATLEEDVDIGEDEVSGSIFGLKGKDKEGVYVSILDYLIALRGDIYSFTFVTRGGRDAANEFKPAIEALVGGIGFIETGENVPGPLATGVPFHVMPRGSYTTKEYEMTAKGIELEKPVGFSKVHSSGDQSVAFALETRSEDGSAYYYVDVRIYDPPGSGQRLPNAKERIEDRSVTFSEHATGEVKLSKRKKGPIDIKVKWGKAKGAGYRFEGEFLGQPFVELGYVVRHRQRTYFIREQFGGADAEKKLKKPAKAIKKAWKWVK